MMASLIALKIADKFAKLYDNESGDYREMSK